MTAPIKTIAWCASSYYHVAALSTQEWTGTSLYIRNLKCHRSFADCGEISFCTAKNRDVGRLRRKFGSSAAQPVQQLGLGRSRQWGCKIASFTAQLMQGKGIYSLSHQKFILLHLFEIEGRLQTSFWSLSPTLSNTMISLSQNLKKWSHHRDCTCVSFTNSILIHI